MDYILKPYAQWKGLNKRKTTRFAEQAWILIYDSFFWSVGMVRIFSIPPDYFFFVEPARSESVHKKMKQKLMYTNTVHLRQFRLFFQSERTLDELSYSFHVTHHEVVLFTAIWFLAAANHRRQHRRTKEGSLADVYAPHFHMRATAHKLRHIRRKSWECHPVHHGSGRYSTCGKSRPPHNFFLACLGIGQSPSLHRFSNVFSKSLEHFEECVSISTNP